MGLWNLDNIHAFPPQGAICSLISTWQMNLNPSGNISPKSFVQLMAAGGGVITLDELGGLNPCSDNGLV
jgi:hypothetical protein